MTLQLSEKIRKQDEFLGRTEVFIGHYDEFPGRIKFNVKYIADFHKQFSEKTKSVISAYSKRVQELEKRFSNILNSFQEN